LRTGKKERPVENQVSPFQSPRLSGLRNFNWTKNRMSNQRRKGRIRLSQMDAQDAVIDRFDGKAW
jgi:hypothetical protein